MLSNIPLRPYQQRGKRKIVENKVSGLLYWMGYGKTLTVLDALQELIFDRLQVTRVLVVAPKRVATIAWPQQIEEWTPRLTYSVVHGSKKDAALNAKAHIYLMGYSSLKWLYRKALNDRSVLRKWDMVIYDESTQLKNQDSKRWEFCYNMFDDIPRKVILTGKPAPNGYLDLWAQLYLLDYGERLFRTKDGFRSAKFIGSGYGHYQRYEPMAGTMEWIAGRISDILDTVTEDDSVVLPELVYNVIECELPPVLQKQYDDFQKNDILKLQGHTLIANNVAASRMKCRQFVQGFVYDTDEFTKVRSVIPIHEEKLAALVEVIEGSGASNVICAVQFDEDVVNIKKKYPFAPVINGATKDKDCERYINDWNAGKIPLLIVHPSSVSFGLNIQHGGNVIVWYGLTWNLEEFEQLIARLHRSGQTQTVMVHILVMKNTLDEVILACVKKKEYTQNALLDALEAYTKVRGLL